MKHTTIKQARSILGGTVECDLEYPIARSRLQDDTDGSTERDHVLEIIQGPDGDMHVGVGGTMLRFRTWGGGGASLATHNALRLLVEAMKMDNERHPQRPQNTQGDTPEGRSPGGCV